MQVGECQHDRRRRGDRFEERQRRPERIVARTAGIDAGPGRAFHDVQQTLDDAIGLGRVGREAEPPRDDIAEPLVSIVVVAECAVDLARLAQRLGNRTERVRVAVRHAVRR